MLRFNLLLLLASLLLIKCEDPAAAASMEGRTMNLTSTSDNCGELAGTWTGMYSYHSNAFDCGTYRCLNTQLIFEDASGDGSAFFVDRPKPSNCRFDNAACSTSPPGATSYVAFCDNSKVDMEGYEGLVSSTRLRLVLDGHSNTYDMQK